MSNHTHSSRLTSGRWRKESWIRGVTCILTLVIGLSVTDLGFGQQRAGKRRDKGIRPSTGAVKKIGGNTQFGKAQTGKYQLGRPLRILAPTLKVRESMGDVANRWLLKRTVYQGQSFQFRWTNNWDDVTTAQWQISDRPLLSNNPDENQDGILKKGWVSKVPDKGSDIFFVLDFRSVMPAQAPTQPKTYYIRMVAHHADSNSRVDSQSVAITHRRDDNPITQFTPEGLGLTVEQKHAWMYKNIPMPIEIDLQELYVGNSNESNGDEPYLIAFVVFADGTFINPLDLPNSRVAIEQANALHGNIPDCDADGEDLDTASTAIIPNSTGRFTGTIRPIGAGLVDKFEDTVILDAENNRSASIGETMKRFTSVYIVVVGMEEDNTSDHAVFQARSAARQVLQRRANEIVRSLDFGQLQAGDLPDFTQEMERFRSEIRREALGAAKDATLVPGWWTPIYLPIFLAQVADTDDYVGYDFQEVTLGQLLDSGPAGIPIELNLNNPNDWEGSYTVKGRIRRTNF